MRVLRGVVFIHDEEQWTKDRDLGDTAGGCARKTGQLHIYTGGTR